MKVGDKYIIEIEEVIRRNGAPQIARVKGFNALVFDKYGLEKLEPYDGEKLYRKGYEEGHRTGMIDGVMNIKVDEVSYQRGYKDGQKDRDMDIPPSIDDAYNRGYKDAEKKYNADLDYKDGLEDGRMEAWECAKKINNMTMDECEKVFGEYRYFGTIAHNLSASEATAKIKEYEQKQTDTKEGHWKESDIPNEKYVCSECGGACWYYDYQGNLGKSNYCPNCGAKMVKPDEGYANDWIGYSR